MKKERLVFVLWCICGVLAFFRFVTIPIYHHLFPKTIGIEEAKQMPTISERHVYIPEHKGRSWTRYGNCVDTIYKNDTLYIYPLKDYHKAGTLELVIQSDSLSGATGATLSIQRSDLGLVWMPDTYQNDSYIINGSNAQEWQHTTQTYNYVNKKIRCKIVASPSTQMTRIKLNYAFERN